MLYSIWILQNLRIAYIISFFVIIRQFAKDIGPMLQSTYYEICRETQSFYFMYIDGKNILHRNNMLSSNVSFISRIAITHEILCYPTSYFVLRDDAKYSPSNIQ